MDETEGLAEKVKLTEIEELTEKGLNEIEGLTEKEKLTEMDGLNEIEDGNGRTDRKRTE